MSRIISVCAACWTLAAALPAAGTALGAVTVPFPSTPSSDTVYDYVYGYPYMMIAGDTITGYRSSAGLPAVNGLSVDIWVDQTYLYCDTVLDFYFDGDWVGSSYLDAYYWWTQIGGSVPVTLTNAEDHVIEIVLYYDAYWCSYPTASFVMFDEVNSTITMDLTGADTDGDGYYATEFYGDDCDDRDASVHPGATETCNGTDDNCDGRVDEGGRTTYYRDADGDGYGSASSPLDACTLPSGYATRSGDCDDGDSTVFPGATETCNGVDDDCDGLVDDDLLATYYRDADGDGFGTSSTSTQACTAPEGYVSDPGDCNDGDDTINPAAAELCDGIDNDCDGATDEGVAVTYYQDADGDGFGDTGSTVDACSLPDGFSSTAGDCDDTDAAVYPSAPEQCDDADNDCDGTIDEGVTPTWYLDQDADGYGTATTTSNACVLPFGYVETADDCDDGDASVHPGAEETCNGIDDDCDGDADEGVKSLYYRDADGDGFGDSGVTTQACSMPGGYSSTSGDCDDTDGEVHPGATEVCNDRDDDCDGAVDDGLLVIFFRDADGDGYGTGTDTVYACSDPGGYTGTGGDCDDGDLEVYPGADERCDGKDNDCDGVADEDAKTVFYQDQDGDGYGIGSVEILACTAPEGYSDTPGDCDDTDATIHPGAIETCNRVDDDCNGAIDEGVTHTYYADADADGFGDPDRPLDACSAPGGYVVDGSDCRDNDPTSHPGASESCDGIDNDCDGSVDEDVLSAFYQDADRDGYGNSAVAEEACERPPGYTADSTDCNDEDSSIHPGAREDCDGIDNDCDGVVDEEVLQTFYADGDGDGHGDPEAPSSACSLPDGHVANDSDCDDTDPGVHPGAIEACNDRDDDCDGEIDEDVMDPWYADTDDDGFGDPEDVVWACSAPAGRVDDDTDCDDTSAGIHPGATEICDDGIDQDCDSYDLGCDLVDDDGDTFSEVDGDCNDADPDVHPGANERCDGQDTDCNGFTDDIDQDGDGFIDTGCNGDDCDDSDATVHPGAKETCDGIDNDCDGTADNLDADGDGYIAAACDGDDCNDGDPLVHPGFTEACDGIDNDCSGAIDDLDTDGDGHIAAACNGDDCNDDDPLVHPGADELPNGQDDDCDGTSDENTGVFDDDGDGYSELEGDCNDDDPDVSPVAEEVPGDSVDNDCDGAIDEPDVMPTPWAAPTPTPPTSPGPQATPTPAAVTPTPTIATTPWPGSTAAPSPTPWYQPTPVAWETPVPGPTPTPLEPTATPGPAATPGSEPTPTPSDMPPESATPGFSDVPTPAAGEGQGCACRTPTGPERPGAGTGLVLLAAMLHGAARRKRRATPNTPAALGTRARTRMAGG